jgi:hypothetical protein
MSKKLQNIKAIQQMIDGNHKFQTKKTVGFSDAEFKAKRNERHDVGDIWEEADPVTGNIYVIEQRDGFRIKKTKNSEIFQQIRDELNTFTKCPKETCTCINPQRVDEKMRRIHDMCFDCVIEMEHELKKTGKFEEYERERVKNNALAWLRSAEQDINLLKQAYTQSTQFVSNSSGDLETWAAKMSPEEFDEKIQKEFERFKENFLNKINGETETNDIID